MRKDAAVRFTLYIFSGLGGLGGVGGVGWVRGGREEGRGKREEGRGKGGGREGFWMDPGDLDICCSGKR